MKALVVIPARGGSKGLPGKNLRTVAGVSLVGRAARVGRQFLRAAGLTGTVLVDTDAQEIADEGRRWGAEVPFLRPAELAADTTPTIDNVLHALGRLESARAVTFDLVVLLQPTSPLRTVDDVLACLRAFDPVVGSAVAVTPVEHPVEQALRMDEQGVVRFAWPGATEAARRQDSPRGYRIAGSVYVNSAASLREHRAFVVPGRTRGVVVPAERAVDIDTAADLATADALAHGAPCATVHVAGRAIGSGHPCFVIAEAGVNHNGDVKLAHELVDVAADAGADAVKFQTFDPHKLASPVAAMAEYQVTNTGKVESQAAMLERLVLPRAAHAELQRHAADRGIVFLSSPFDEASADFLEELDVPAFKIPSGELVNHPFLAHVARKGRPMLISSGMADIAEVAAALDVVSAAGAPPVALFHCVTNYPAAPADSNLRAIGSLRATFGLPAGWSDHTEGITVSLASVALGAQLVEKHYTLDRGMEGPDHRASLEPRELAELVRGIRAIESSLGDGIKRPRPVEIPLIAAARKSLHAARDLPAGHVITREDLVAVRPGTGISPAQLDRVLGRRLAVGVAAWELLAERHLGG